MLQIILAYLNTLKSPNVCHEAKIVPGSGGSTDAENATSHHQLTNLPVSHNPRLDSYQPNIPYGYNYTPCRTLIPLQK